MEIVNEFLKSRDMVLLLILIMFFLILSIVFCFVLIIFSSRSWAKKVYRLFKEIVLTCSNRESLFSIKRIQNWGIYLMVMSANLLYVFHYRNSLTHSEFFVWSAGMFFAIGWGVKQLQQEKKDESK